MTVDTSSKVFMLPSGPSSLSFEKEEFMKHDFEVDKFIVECRKKVPLETLRDDLDIYLKVIRSAMIELINKDYADFVNLSTNLVGMDKAISHLTTPLGQLKEEVLSVQTAMEGAIQAVESKIKKQQDIQRKKAVLQRLLNIQNSVEKIEKLLGIEAGAEAGVSPSQLTGPLIERVATEFNKLQFYVSRSKGHPLVDKVKPRIAAITTTLQFSLEGSFLSGLETSNLGVLRQCLRTYALIDKTKDAEDLFREHVVRPYMEDVIEEKMVRNVDQMSKMLDQVHDFVPSRCSDLLAITTGAGGSGGEIVRGYDFLAKAVFPEIVSCLETKASLMFAPGNPDIFLTKYVTFINFMNKFESSLSSIASVKRLRASPSYMSVMSKWSLPVYFQIRFQSIAGSLEACLNSSLSHASDTKVFKLEATVTLWSALNKCWDEGIYLPALLHRFLKLNLQLLSRYKNWLEEILEKENNNRSSSVAEKKSRSSTPDKLSSTSTNSSSGTDLVGLERRSGSPHLSHEVAGINTAQIVGLLYDLDKLNSKVRELIHEKISPRLKESQIKETTQIEDVLRNAVQKVYNISPLFSPLVTDELTKSCGTFLSQVNDIPRLYRRTNKEVPTKPSGYVSAVMKPLTKFCEDHSHSLSDTQKAAFLIEVFKSLIQQFSEVTQEVLTSTKKMEESLRRLKKARGGDKEEKTKSGVSDSDKIRTQLKIDISNFQLQMNALKVNITDVDESHKLESLAKEAEADMTS